jgi:hypothetical protein
LAGGIGGSIFGHPLIVLVLFIAPISNRKLTIISALLVFIT